MKNSNNIFKRGLLAITVLASMVFSCEQVELAPVADVPSPIAGVNYYRLEQMDFDGTVTTFDVMATQMDEASSAKTNTRVLAASATSTQTGSWIDDATWTTSSPGYSLGNGATIVVEQNHYVTVEGNLIAGNNVTITVKANATLDMLAMDANNGAIIVVEAGGTLILRSDFSLNNNLYIENNGILIIMGNVDVKGNGSSEIDNVSGDMYIYDPAADFGNSTMNGSGMKSENDLMNDYPDLYSTLPITLLYQHATAQEDGSVLVEWETAEEEDASHVTVQWSVDGEEWVDLTQIKCENKPSNYSYIHR